jgi:hypothetical protein
MTPLPGKLKLFWVHSLGSSADRAHEKYYSNRFFQVITDIITNVIVEASLHPFCTNLQLYIFPIFSDFFDHFSGLFLGYFSKGITPHKAYPGPSTEGYALRGFRLYP